MPDHLHSFPGWLSRILAGGAIGCGVLFVGDFLVITPIWEGRLRLVKSDTWRWEAAFLVAKFGLPAAFVLGALAGLVWRPSRTVRLSRQALVGCCLAVAYVSLTLRPDVARTRTGAYPPLYELVPDTMALLVCLLALVIVVWPVGLWRPVRAVGESSVSPEQEDA
jgi:hypothetical protein